MNESSDIDLSCLGILGSLEASSGDKIIGLASLMPKMMAILSLFSITVEDKPAAVASSSGHRSLATISNEVS